MKTFKTLMVLVMAIGFAMTAQALDTRVVTFDNGQEGWTAGPDCQTILDGGPSGAYWNFVNQDCANTYYLRAFFRTWNDTDPSFIGDYTAKGPVRISLDVDVNVYDLFSFFGPPLQVEEYRALVVEFVDYDMQYTDPDTGHSWPWTSVQVIVDFFQNRENGWKEFSVDIVDPNATELPDGWVGFGGPEDPNTYISQLPPGVTFADVMAGVDEIQFHSIEPGYFYQIGFIHDLNFDNITIQEIPRVCAGQDATIYVNNDGYVVGGPNDGLLYDGELPGTHGNDVMVGTSGDDTITGHKGNDIICGAAGNDNINGQHDNDVIFGGEGDDNLIGQGGDDYIDGGPGYDHINGGQGGNTCGNGENVQHCAASSGRTTQERGRSLIGKRATPVRIETPSGGVTVQGK